MKVMFLPLVSNKTLQKQDTPPGMTRRRDSARIQNQPVGCHTHLVREAPLAYDKGLMFRPEVEQDQSYWPIVLIP